MGVITEILKYSNEIQNDRNELSILSHLLSEVSELDVEVALHFDGMHPGDDGIMGEAVDVILCAVDLIHRTNPDVTEADIMTVVARKLEKWKALYGNVGNLKENR